METIQTSPASTFPRIASSWAENENEWQNDPVKTYLRKVIKAVIIDDEDHSIETLEWKIRNYCSDIEILGTFSSPMEGLDFVNSNQIDLLFLDIEMPLLSGFDLLQKIENISFDVIFTTAYDEYGIRAIKFSALDYLLKPVEIQELENAVEKCRSKKVNSTVPAQLEVLFESLQFPRNTNQKIALSTKESIELVNSRDIIYCESDNNYTTVYMEGRKKLISKTLKEFEELLVPHNFFRTHQSYLVNIDHIREYVRQDGGYLVMSNQKSVPVSRNKKEGVLKLF